MKFFQVGLLFACSVVSGFGQVDVNLELEQEQYLPGEKMVAKVRITNRSGQTLELGEKSEWLTFNFESVDGPAIAKVDELPVEGKFTLQSSLEALKRVDLSEGYNLTVPGRYTISAIVKIPDWKEEFATKAVRFEIVRGTRLWEQAFGVPQRGASGAPETRKYILQQATRARQLRLYARITDENEGRTFKTLNLGTRLSFGQPEARLDRVNNLHVVHQTYNRFFQYVVINPDGEMLKQEHYEQTQSRPHLVVEDTGAVHEAGGTLRQADGEGNGAK